MALITGGLLSGGIGAYVNQYGPSTKTITMSQTNANTIDYTYLLQQQLGAGIATQKPAPVAPDEFSWLRRRVAEVSFQ